MAAAACVVASGLFVVGSPAPAASAGPDRGYNDGDRHAGPLRDFRRGNGPESRDRGWAPAAGWQQGKRVLREIRIASQTRPTKPGEDWPPTEPGEEGPGGEPWKPHRPWWMDCGGGVGQPPGNPGSGGGGGGNGGGVSTSRPPTLPSHLPPAYGGGLPNGLPSASTEPIVGPGVVAAGAAAAPLAPIALPAIVVPVALPGGLAGGGGVRPGALGRPTTEPAPTRQSPPGARAGQEASPSSVPASTYRAGYGSYLRSAGPGEIAAVALPGFVGILLLTGAGGLIGYRQARAGRTIRAGAMERFMS